MACGRARELSPVTPARRNAHTLVVGREERPEGKDTMLKIALVDDSPVIQRSVSRVLRAMPGVELVGMAEDLAGALRLIDDHEPDLVLLDVNLPRGEKGIDVLHHVMQAHPKTQVIVLTNAVSPTLRRSYLDAGARGYFDKASEFGLACAWIASRVGVPAATSSSAASSPSFGQSP